MTVKGQGNLPTPPLYPGGDVAGPIAYATGGRGGIKKAWICPDAFLKKSMLSHLFKFNLTNPYRYV